MAYDSFVCFRVDVEPAIAWVTIDYGPINLMDLTMIGELNTLAQRLADDTSIKVIVFRSANPDFFIAHADLKLLLAMQKNPFDPTCLNPLNEALELFRTMGKVSIAQIEGQAQGGGSEFALGLDMRFAAIGKTRLGQPETALGIIPGGGGCTRLPALVGRGRALEILLGCETFDAEEAERYGYVNRALPAEDMSDYVERLARRIASFPATAIAGVKQTVNLSLALSVEQKLLLEQQAYVTAAAEPESTRRMEKALALGMQQAEVELHQLDDLLLRLSEP